jgi:hypothetical protein
MLKAGWCTVLFNAFLQGKMGTQVLKGGNTTELYGKGTAEKSRMLVEVHPEYARLRYWNERVHHLVDYTKFKQRLIRRVQQPEKFELKKVMKKEGQ